METSDVAEMTYGQWIELPDNEKCRMQFKTATCAKLESKEELVLRVLEYIAIRSIEGADGLRAIRLDELNRFFQRPLKKFETSIHKVLLELSEAYKIKLLVGDRHRGVMTTNQWIESQANPIMSEWEFKQRMLYPDKSI